MIGFSQYGYISPPNLGIYYEASFLDSTIASNVKNKENKLRKKYICVCIIF